MRTTHSHPNYVTTNRVSFCQPNGATVTSLVCCTYELSSNQRTRVVERDIVFARKIGIEI